MTRTEATDGVISAGGELAQDSRMSSVERMSIGMRPLLAGAAPESKAARIVLEMAYRPHLMGLWSPYPHSQIQTRLATILSCWPGPPKSGFWAISCVNHVRTDLSGRKAIISTDGSQAKVSATIEKYLYYEAKRKKFIRSRGADLRCKSTGVSSLDLPIGDTKGLCGPDDSGLSGGPPSFSVVSRVQADKGKPSRQLLNP